MGALGKPVTTVGGKLKVKRAKISSSFSISGPCFLKSFDNPSVTKLIVVPQNAVVRLRDLFDDYWTNPTVSLSKPTE